MKEKEKSKKEVMKLLAREKKRNYVILYSVTLIILIALIFISYLMKAFNVSEFVNNIINNIIGILPALLIFDFFNEMLTRESSSLEISNTITDTLMSNPENLELFSEEQRRNFIKSGIASIVKDSDVTEMLNMTLQEYLVSNPNYKIKTEFRYNFDLKEAIPEKCYPIIKDRNKYFYVQEVLSYRIRSIYGETGIIKNNSVKIGFVFENKSLDNVLRDRENDIDFNGCIFRESLNLCEEDRRELIKITEDDKKRSFVKEILKLSVQIDNEKASLGEVKITESGILIEMKFEKTDTDLKEDIVKIVFCMPKLWDSILEVAIVDPTRSPQISLSYQEESMVVDMIPFLNKRESTCIESSCLEEHGIYDISMEDEWVYPISGVVFCVSKKKKEDTEAK